MVRIKSGPYGARLHGLNPVMVIAIIIVNQWMDFYGLEYEISGAIEGEHSRGSLHFTGNALDWAVRNQLPSQTIQDMSSKIRDDLADDFDVVYYHEEMRIHVEFQPKTSYGRLGDE